MDDRLGHPLPVIQAYRIPAMDNTRIDGFQRLIDIVTDGAIALQSPQDHFQGAVTPEATDQDMWEFDPPLFIDKYRDKFHRAVRGHIPAGKGKGQFYMEQASTAFH